MTPAAPRYRGILIATILASGLAFIDGSIVNVILPKIQSDFGKTLADAQWVIQAYGLFLSTFLLLGGALGDHYGRKRVFQIGLFVFLGASAACAAAGTFEWLVVARSLQGLGAAMLAPGSLAIINASFPKESRAQAIGTWSAFSAITAAAGPALGGWLADAMGWRAAFLINLPLGAVALAFAAYAIPPGRRDEAAGRLDFVGTLLSTLGIGGLIVALAQRSIPALGIGAAFLAVFLWHERRTARPILPLAIFRSRVFSLTNAFTVALYAALGGGFLYLPLHLILVESYTSAQAGLATLPFVLILFALSRSAGNGMQRWGARAMLTAGPLVAALGFALMAALPRAGRPYLLSYFPGIVALGLGMAITVAPLTTTALGALDDARSGLASGVNNAAARLAGLFGVALVAVVAPAPSWTALHVSFAAMAILCLAAALLGGALPSPPRK